MKLTTRAALAAIALLAVPCQSQTNILRNSSFENGGLAGWSPFGNVFAETNNPGIVPRTGTTLAKMFGGFTGQANVAGIFQSYQAVPGEAFVLDCWSRHWSGDPLIGSGAANNENSMVMKIAFFDNAQMEIFGVEATILDGTSPQDVWINHIPIQATAPAGTVEVQALILFLQPGVDGGAGQIDDVEFFAFPDIAPYPGSGDDLLLTTGVGAGGPSGGKSNYVKTALPGDVLEFNVTSPNGTYDGEPYFLLGQLFATGAPRAITFPALWFDQVTPVFFLTGAPSGVPVGAPVVASGTGSSSFFLAPPGFAGVSLMAHALVVDSGAMNGLWATSDGYEIKFQ